MLEHIFLSAKSKVCYAIIKQDEVKQSIKPISDKLLRWFTLLVKRDILLWWEWSMELLHHTGIAS